MSSSLSAAAFLKLIVCHNRSGRRTAARAAEARHRNQRLSAPPPTVGGEGEAEERGVGRAKGRTDGRVHHLAVCRRWYRLPFHHTRGRASTDERGNQSEGGFASVALSGSDLWGCNKLYTHTERSRTGRRVKMSALRGKRLWVRVTPIMLEHGTDGDCTMHLLIELLLPE